ncbi:MAG: YggS family pyridoxal phosphate-dependent enzyme [Opitutaceae bacterium]
MSLTYTAFCDHVAEVRSRIAESCARAGRNPAEVRLLPVTKTQPPEVVQFVVQHGGFEAVGENRVQETAEKRPRVAGGLRWELIGHLQSNKARQAVELFERIQSVDRDKVLIALDRAAGEQGRRLAVLLQVNAGNDPAKFGVDPEAAPALLEQALQLPHLRVEGLMTIAPLSDDPTVARRTFARLREIRDDLVKRFGLPLNELSMGMSGDLDAAIAEGSTLVRVGSALFGARG